MVTGLFFQGCICVPGLNGDLTGGKAEASCGKGAGILVSPTSALERDGRMELRLFVPCVPGGTATLVYERCQQCWVWAFQLFPGGETEGDGVATWKLCCWQVVFCRY